MKCLLVFAIVLFAAVAANSQASPDETAVRNIIQEEITAWNASDAGAYSRHFAADGTLTNIRGRFFTGRPLSRGMTTCSRGRSTEVLCGRILFP
jgi:hypothetical protein